MLNDETNKKINFKKKGKKKKTLSQYGRAIQTHDSGYENEIIS
jgi:hypothetical protein